jgi:hypothetical protein
MLGLYLTTEENTNVSKSFRAKTKNGPNLVDNYE